MTIREEAAEWAKKNRPSGLLAQVIAAEAYESAFDGETVRALVALLKEFLDINDEPCRHDHHGYCQAHYLEDDCLIKRTKLKIGDL